MRATEKPFWTVRATPDAFETRFIIQKVMNW